MKKKIIAWLELIRLPNIFTVPGDPVLGYVWLLPTLSIDLKPLLGAIISVCLLYFAGMILNDIMDYKEDLRDRPQRPLPSGRISKTSAWIVFILLSISGLLAAYLTEMGVFRAALILYGCIIIYDCGAKKVMIIGPLFMGLCRAFSVLVGAAAVSGKHDMSEAVSIIFTFHIIYIAFVTILARYETGGKVPPLFRWLPLLICIAGYGFMLKFSAATFNIPLALFILFGSFSVFLTVDATRCIKARSGVTPPVIGQLISNLIIIQCAFIFLREYYVLAGILLTGWYLNRLIRAKIYAS